MVLLFLAHLPFAMNPHIGNKALALRERRHLRTFLLLAIPIGSILGATVLGGLQARALLGPGLSAYSGETGHPIRGKWPPGRSEATLGIS